MKIFSRQDLRNQLKRGEIAPTYVLFGAETYLRDLAAKTITDISFKDSALREFNEAEISLNEVGIGHALSSAEQLPMMDSRRVIRITNVSVSSNKSKDNISENDEGLLEDYLSKPAETSVLIFLVDELDKRRKISKLLLSKSCAIEFKPLQDGELVKWACDKFSDFKVRIEDRTLQLLIALVGDDVRKLTLEVEKLALASLPEGVVSNELVESLISSSREISNFELTDHLLSNNKRRALNVMKKILDDGAEPLMLLGLLSYNFRRLLMAKELMNEGVERKEISRVMRLPYSKEQSFLETARRTERTKFSMILQRLSEVDLAIKTSVATPRLQIEMLVCELACT